MKLIIFILSFTILSARIVNAQSQNNSEEQSDTNRHFYKSYEDFENNKPTTGIRYNGYGNLDNKLVATINGRDIYDYPKKYEYWGVTDETGQLMRIYNNRLYYVIVHPKTGSSQKIFCYIFRGEYSYVGTDYYGKVTLSFGGTYTDYVSNGPEGEIKKASDNYLEELFADKPGLYKKYKDEEIDKTEYKGENVLTKSSHIRRDETLKLWNYSEIYNGSTRVWQISIR